MKGERPRFLVSLFAAALSALVVAGVYEVRARVARSAGRAPERAERDTEAPGERPWRPGPTGSAAATDCSDLRRRYLRQCPADLPDGTASQVSRTPGPPTSPAPDQRAAAALSAWLNPSPDELGEMARKCEVRFEMPAITDNEPPVVTDEQVAALSLSDHERDVLQGTLRQLHTELRGFAQTALAGLPASAGASKEAAPATLEEMLGELRTRPGSGFEEGREKLARERAALAIPAGPSAEQPPGERLLRTWATLGDQLERQLATELGKDRARQLRTSPQAGWMNRFSEAGCRTDSPRPTN